MGLIVDKTPSKRNRTSLMEYYGQEKDPNKQFYEGDRPSHRAGSWDAYSGDPVADYNVGAGMGDEFEMQRGGRYLSEGNYDDLGDWGEGSFEDDYWLNEMEGGYRDPKFQPNVGGRYMKGGISGLLGRMNSDLGGLLGGYRKPPPESDEEGSGNLWDY